jgi:hypothetical protein
MIYLITYARMVRVNIPSNQGHRYSPVYTTPDLTVSSTLIAEVRYVCGLDGCNKDYSQRQGVLRHHREAHKTPHPCFDSRCGFKWTRPYEYTTHLKTRHPRVDPDKVLGKRARSPSKSTIIGEDRPPHLFRAPSERRSQAEPQQRPSTPPLPTEAKFTHVPLPAMPPMACDPQPECPEPAITTRRNDTFGLESPGATDPPSAFSEAFAEIGELRTGDQNRMVRALLFIPSDF